MITFACCQLQSCGEIGKKFKGNEPMKYKMKKTLRAITAKLDKSHKAQSHDKVLSVITSSFSSSPKQKKKITWHADKVRER
jgi:hypothetical protein